MCEQQNATQQHLDYDEEVAGSLRMAYARRSDDSIHHWPYDLLLSVGWHTRLHLIQHHHGFRVALLHNLADYRCSDVLGRSVPGQNVCVVSIRLLVCATYNRLYCHIRVLLWTAVPVGNSWRLLSTVQHEEKGDAGHSSC